jgi:molybdate transport system substrate-binding protein
MVSGMSKSLIIRVGTVLAAAVTWCFLLFLTAGSIANAVEIKFLSPLAMEPALRDLIPQFERSSGQNVAIQYASAATLAKRIEIGEAADMVILSPDQIEDLQKQGKIVPGSQAVVAKVGFAVIIRKGAAKPDISSVETFKRSLLAAKSIGVGDPAWSASGKYFAEVVERLGIAAEVKPKTRLFPSGKAALDAISRGVAEIGLEVTSATNRAGIEHAGPLPAEIQTSNIYAAGIVASSQHPEAVKTLISFLSSPGGRAVLKAKGFELP